MVLPANAEEYARELYASMRQADEIGVSSIMILLPRARKACGRRWWMAEARGSALADHLTGWQH